MLTAEVIRRDKPEMTDANMAAFLRFAKCFDCLDSESYQEAYERILASMNMVSDELDCTDNPYEQQEIIRRHYGKL